MWFGSARKIRYRLVQVERPKCTPPAFSHVTFERKTIMVCTRMLRYVENVGVDGFVHCKSGAPTITELISPTHVSHF